MSLRNLQLETILRPTLLFRCHQVFGYLFVAMIFHSLMVAQTPRLMLDTVNIGNTAQVVFSTFPAVAATSSSNNQGQYRFETDDQKYLITIDVGSIKSILYDAFTFDAALKRQRHGDEAWYAYSVRATSVGKFADVLANVKFKIVDGSQESSGTLRLPLHNNGYDGDLLRKAEDSSILTIRASDPQPPALIFQNALDNLEITVTKIAVARGCYRCWEEPKPQEIGTIIKPSATAQIPLQIRPKPLPAMFSTAFKMKRDQPQDVLRLTVDYNVAQGGTTKQKTFEVPVRFSPSIWQLAAAVILGSLVGAIVKRMVDETVTKFSWKFVVRAIFLASVAEFLACVFATFDSKVIILSFDMDPRQIIPAALLAFVTTGGPPVVKWIWGIVRPGSQQSAAAGASAGGGRS